MNSTLVAAEDRERHVERLRALRIGVVYGPVSEEDALYIREVPRDQWSLTSLMETLNRLDIHAEHLDPTDPNFPVRAREFNLLLVNVHGPFGEDGRLQGLLDYLGVPYTSSGVLASSVGMDKAVTKALFSALEIPTPRSWPVPATGGVQLPDGAELPCMLKAVDGGSSVGLELVTDSDHFPAAVSRLHDRGFAELFLERFVSGRSVTVSVIRLFENRRALPPLECIIDGQQGPVYYDEAAKLGGRAAPRMDYRVPQDMPVASVKAMVESTERVYDFLHCTGAMRMDFVVDGEQPYALEINTCPGMQASSNLPVAAASAGLSYDDLVIALLADAASRHDGRLWQ